MSTPPNWDQMASDWRQQHPAALDVQQLIESAKARNIGLHKRIRRRDLLETIVALGIIPVFAANAWVELSQGAWVTGLACLWLVAWCAFVPWKLRQARRGTQQLTADCDIYRYLKSEREILAGQLRMLKGIFWWYLGPAAVGVLTLFVGINGWSKRSAVYAGAVVILYGVIYTMNQHAARHRIMPKLNEVDQQLAELENDK